MLVNFWKSATLLRVRNSRSFSLRSRGCGMLIRWPLCDHVIQPASMLASSLIKESLGSMRSSSWTLLIESLRMRAASKGRTSPNSAPTSAVQFTQESLANAKVSARQPWYKGRNLLNRPWLRIAQKYQRYLYIIEKYFQCATIPSPTMRVYLHSFSHCCLPNMPTSAKFQENLNLQQFKVIKGQWFGNNRSAYATSY